MPWPLSQDYNEALQNPQTSFSDPELRQGQVVVNALGIPQPCSGNFADVYAVECPASETKWAVKCFTREVRGLRERYSEICNHLEKVRLPFTVDFQYLEHGIRIAGRWYPILKMHWVEGFTLNTYVRDILDKSVETASGRHYREKSHAANVDPAAEPNDGDRPEGPMTYPGNTPSAFTVRTAIST